MEQKSSLTKRIIKYWIPVLSMLGAMYYFSTDVFASENTRDLIESIIKWIHGGISHRSLMKVNYYVRKAAHFIEYGFLAILLFRAFKADSQQRWKFRWCIYSLMVVIPWSVLDEVHQFFTKRRGASINDSILDSAGGLTAIILITFLALWKPGESRKNK